ncbi:sigma-70 family RNA polymerase sigma factor [Streptomyces sp. NPDC085929]|uniref:sigma-70 family RNA polymerase sigma factor n=1 Tax=Streptomyces sp. NPDC085929 TaxID=3365739 RepID=UPI0037CE177A
MPHGRSRPVGAPDHELTALIRNGTDQEPVRILYERHWRNVLHYARSCCRSPHTAEDLASEAFVRTLEAIRDGHGPSTAWRPYLLTVVRRTAAQWAVSDRRIELSEDFERWCDEHVGAAGSPSVEDRLLRYEDRQMVLHGFRSLPERWQAVLWYSEVDQQPASAVARLLGLSRSGVSSLAARAREGLREAYLAAHLRRTSGNEQCRRYGSLLAAAARKPGARVKSVLAAHLDVCPACRRAMTELTDLSKRIGTVLPGGVLLWGGERNASGGAAAFAAGGGSGSTPGPALAQPAPTGPLRSPARAWGTGAVAVAATGVAVAVLVSGHPPQGPGSGAPRAAASPALAPAAVPAVTGTQGPSSTPTPTPSATASATPSATPSPAPAATESPAPAVPNWAPAPDDRTRMWIAATGRCIEIPGAATAPDVQAREASCDGSAAQQWDVLMPYDGDRSRLQLRNTATGLCLGGSGTTKDAAPVTQRACDPRDGRQVWRLYSQDGTAGRFFDQNVTMTLGLSDWYKGESGLPHSPEIGTNHNYYNSPSFSIRFDGSLFDGRMQDVSSRKS